MGLTLAAAEKTSDARPIRVSSDFDRGSIGDLREVEPGHLRGQTRHWVQASGQNDQRYWFYFKLEGVEGREISFELTDMFGVYRGRPHRGIIDDATQPVVTYDGVTWHRVSGGHISEDGVWTFKYLFRSSPAWIAYAHPYTLGQATRWIEEVAKNPAVEKKTIGQSAEGRPITVLRIGSKEPRKVVLLSSLIHPGEDASGYLLEGIVAFLLGDNARAKALRRDVRFEIIPVMNPDGLFRGEARLNAHLEDLNAAWDPAIGDHAGEPEIAAVRGWLTQVYGATTKLDVHLDLHCAGQRRTNIALVSTDAWLQDTLGPLIAKSFPMKPVKGGFAGSFADFTQARYGAHSATLEISQSRYGAENNSYLTIDDYRAGGVTLGKALEALMRSDQPDL
jgi:hypothetical protein